MNPSSNRPPLDDMTLRQLRRVASELGISRYSRMRKDQLLAAITEKATVPALPLAPGVAPSSTQVRPLEAQEEVEASKFELGQSAPTAEVLVSLASVDDVLADLPGGYGESRIVLMPRDPQWAYAYWDVTNEAKEGLRRQGGQQLALRIYDVTDIDVSRQRAHSVQEYPCDELATEWYLPIPVSDRDYAAEIGYRCADGRWLALARSAEVRVPPVYPSDWIEDIFLSVTWDQDLRGRTVAQLVPPTQRGTVEANGLYQRIFDLAEGAESQRQAGSLFGSMQHVAGSVQNVAGSVQHVAGSVQHVAGSIQQVAGSIQHVAGSVQHMAGSIQHLGEQALSSYVFPSGAGLWALPTASGLNMSGIGLGSSASAPPIRPRQFWLVADAELIVYGATEPDATVTIAGQPVKLNPDGTFRFQMSFQDGVIDYPILAVAADGEQTRSIHMNFERQTPSRQTNTKEEAVVEWLA